MKSIIILLIAFSFNANAQSIHRSVIGAAGKTATAGNVILSGTVAEMSTATLNAPSAKITQGFHQGNLTIARITAGEIIEEDQELKREQPGFAAEFKVEVYPNPATDYINIRTSGNDIRTMAMIYDATGKMIRLITLDGLENRVDFTDFAEGKYIVSVKAEDGTINESFRIIKVN
jgi:hypothetical protein